jgi:hypothetical protein
MPEPGIGRSPAQVDADVAGLQEGIRRARATFEAARPAATRMGTPRPQDEAAYREAVAQVTYATRALVDYEARIPQLLDEHRQHVGARILRWSGGLLAAESAALGIAAAVGAIAGWWLIPAATLVVVGLIPVPSARRRASDSGFRPRIGAFLFGVAGLALAVGSLGGVTPWAVLAAPLAAWVGLRAFAVRIGGDPTRGAPDYDVNASPDNERVRVGR